MEKRQPARREKNTSSITLWVPHFSRLLREVGILNDPNLAGSYPPSIASVIDIEYFGSARFIAAANASAAARIISNDA